MLVNGDMTMFRATRVFQILGFKNNLSYQTGHTEIKNEQINREILVLLAVCEQSFGSLRRGEAYVFIHAVLRRWFCC